MATIIDDDQLVADGTEQTVVTSAVAGVFVFAIDLENMASGDSITIRIKTKVLSSSTSREVVQAIYTDAQVDPDIHVESIPIVSPQEVVVTVEQTAGTNRNYQWHFKQLANVVVTASGTTSITTSEASLATDTGNKTYVLITDHVLQLASANVDLRLKSKIRVGQAFEEVYQTNITGPPAAPDINQQSVPLSAPFEVEAAAQRTGGSSFNLDWALCEIG